jgi:hypothetical protein
MKYVSASFLILFLAVVFIQGSNRDVLAAEAMTGTDFSGLWVVSNRSVRGYLDENFERLEPEDYLTAAAIELTENVRPAFDPSAICLASMPRHLGGPYPIEIVQSEGRVVQLFEYENVFRIIYTDGREHPDPVEDQRFMGHSIGEWQDDGSLMVDVTNFNGKAWIAANGIPVSQNAHLMEWYSLIEDGQTLEVTQRYEDAEYFSRPVWRKYFFNLRNDWGIREYFCAEGNRDNVFQQREGMPGSLRLEDVLPE